MIKLLLPLAALLAAVSPLSASCSPEQQKAKDFGQLVARGKFTAGQSCVIYRKAEDDQIVYRLRSDDPALAYRNDTICLDKKRSFARFLTVTLAKEGQPDDTEGVGQDGLSDYPYGVYLKNGSEKTVAVADIGSSDTDEIYERIVFNFEHRPRSKRFGQMTSIRFGRTHCSISETPFPIRD